MARLICEGVKVRVDDVWAGDNNGKSFYVDIANFGDLMPKDGDEVTEEVRLLPQGRQSLSWRTLHRP